MLAVAQAAIAVELKPYRATYEIKRSLLKGQVTVTLSVDPRSDTYLYQSEGKPTGLIGALVSRNPTDATRFEISSEGLKPLQVEIRDGTDKGKKDMAVEFDWAERVLKVTRNGKTSIQPLAPDTHSIHTADLSMRLALQNGAPPGPFAVFDKNRMREFRYEPLGEHELSTALGKLATVKYQLTRADSERRIVQWLAPELGYLPVRAEQYRDGKTLYTMRIKSFAWE